MAKNNELLHDVDSVVKKDQKLKKEIKKLKPKLKTSSKKIEKKKTKEVKKIAKKKTKEVKKIEKKKTKKEEREEQRTLEEELEEQLTDDEIVNFQIEKINMEKLTHKVCEILATRDSEGLFQSDLWKKLKVSSRDGSRLALRLERLGIISREKVLEKERWTYKLVLEKTPVSTQSIENAPCLTCPVEQKCSLDGEISPRTCQWIEDWVLIQTSAKKKS